MEQGSLVRRGALSALIPVLVACSAVPGADPSGSPADPSPTVPAESSPAASPTPTDLPAPVDLAGFRREFGPDAGVAVAALDGTGPVAVAGAGVPYAWSTIKVVIVARLAADVGGPDALTPEQRSLVTAALSRSDNEAAAALYRDLEERHGGLAGAAAAMTELLRGAGDRNTDVSTVARADFSTYGQTRWPVAEQVRFLAAFARGCVVDRPVTRYVLDEMGGVVPEQRWGLGTVGSPAFKGGWGPDPDGRYLVRQFGLFPTSRGDTAVAIAARPPDGTFESGMAEVDRIADWLGRRISPAPAPLSCR